MSLSKEELEAAACYRSLKYFCKRAWDEVNSSPLVWNWHCDAIVDHLQAVYDGKIKNLIINIPPGHAKSMFVSVLFPAWVWINRPASKFITASHTIKLAERDTVFSRDLMKSEWYSKFFRGPKSPFTTSQPWEFSEGQDLKGFYKNTRLGHRVAMSVSSGGTGYRADYLLMDDLLDVGDAGNNLAMENVSNWFSKMASRGNNMSDYRKILIMQRLHMNDPTGLLLKQGGFTHLKLPSEFDPKQRCVTYLDDGTLFWQDPRTEENELLFPAMFPRKVLDELKSGRGVGSVQYLGQYQQEPFDVSGGIIKESWLQKRYKYANEFANPKFSSVVSFPDKFDTMNIFCDATYKGTDKSDRVAIGVFGTKGQDHYLVDMVWDRMYFTQTVQAIIDLKLKWQNVEGIYIEDRANGSAIIDTLRGKVNGVIEMQPEGGKEARVSAASTYIQAQNLVLPQSAWYVEELVAEMVSFPKARHDDGVDMVSYAMIQLAQKASFLWLEGMINDRDTSNRLGS